ncbi:MAG TPA: alkaline phosphatase family protein [Gemmatimonadaceae bacterium]|nr:alkaline phosphatase family protein [Gemmatimonadaceae bacterium]
MTGRRVGRIAQCAVLLPLLFIARGLAAQANPHPAPTLIVMITVDQFRGDYLDRFAPLPGGLGRLARGGAFFTNAWQDHATTETSPGHASTLSGRFPAHTGIANNSLGVADPQAPLVGAPGSGASPFRFRGETLIDWLRSSDPRSRALSVSTKDRGAILPIGRAHQEVYWYAANGTYTTSTYYRDTLPSWVASFNARRLPASFAGRSWTLLAASSKYPEPDSVSVENGGRDVTFPHVAPTDTAAAVRTLPNFPWADEVTLQFALQGVTALHLGDGPATDLLAVSLSATDYIGHRYGPDSREVHDQILRLDRVLGIFLDSLYRLRDSSRVVIALTADHGVAPFPAVHFAHDAPGTGFVDLRPVLEPMQRALRERQVDPRAFRLEDGMLLVDRDQVAASGLSADSLVSTFVAAARAVDGVERVDFVRDLAHADTVRDTVARRWYHALPPDLDAAAVVTLQPYHLWAGTRLAMHGSPHDYDAHVPILLVGPPFRPGRYTGEARVVDIAPTLAWVAHVRPTEPVDGHVLRAALRDSAQQPSAGH